MPRSAWCLLAYKCVLRPHRCCFNSMKCMWCLAHCCALNRDTVHLLCWRCSPKRVTLHAVLLLSNDIPRAQPGACIARGLGR